MEYKKNSFLITIVDDDVVIGEVTQWDWYSLRIVSVSPYPGWEQHMLNFGRENEVNSHNFMVCLGI